MKFFLFGKTPTKKEENSTFQHLMYISRRHIRLVVIMTERVLPFGKEHIREG